MTHELVADGKTYISSKRASQMSGYAQDYIGQLARKQLIDARRIGGLWYVFLDSLMGYQQKASEYKPQPPVFNPDANSAPDTVISFDGRDYLSAARAATVTGYHQDYVGQLARSGAVLSRQVGNRWYVDRESIVSHKSSKDALLAAVQSDAVGLSRAGQGNDVSRSVGEEPMTYFSDTADLLPLTTSAPGKGDTAQYHEPVLASQQQMTQTTEIVPEEREDAGYTAVPIRRVATAPEGLASHMPHRSTARRRAKRGASRHVYLGAGALATIVIVLSLGYGSLKGGATYTVVNRVSNAAAAFKAGSPLQIIADMLEQHLIPALTYERN